MTERALLALNLAGAAPVLRQEEVLHPDQLRHALLLIRRRSSTTSTHRTTDSHRGVWLELHLPEARSSTNTLERTADR
jgi:hypothetical protein